jgi:hypothetical protein
MGKAATVKHLRELERQHRTMILVNRYLKAGKRDRLADLGISRTEADRLVKAGGYSSIELERMRDTIRYYRTKSRRRLWLPDNGETA